MNVVVNNVAATAMKGSAMPIEVTWIKGGVMYTGTLVQFILNNGYITGIVIDSAKKFVLINYQDLTFARWL